MLNIIEEQLYKYCILSISVTCPALTLTNGIVSYDVSAENERYPAGATASFSCNYGYSMSGSTSRTCQTSGNWEQQLPTCSQSNDITFVLNVSISYIHK